MANYLQIPVNKVSSFRMVKFIEWFAVDATETGDGRWVIPVKALKDMRDDILPILENQVNRDKLIVARDYLEARTVLNGNDITWKEPEL